MTFHTEDSKHGILLIEDELGPRYVYDKATGKIHYTKSSASVPSVPFSGLPKVAREVLGQAIQKYGNSEMLQLASRLDKTQSLLIPYAEKLATIRANRTSKGRVSLTIYEGWDPNKGWNSIVVGAPKYTTATSNPKYLIDRITLEREDSRGLIGTLKRSNNFKVSPLIHLSVHGSEGGGYTDEKYGWTNHMEEGIRYRFSFKTDVNGMPKETVSVTRETEFRNELRHTWIKQHILPTKEPSALLLDRALDLANAVNNVL